MKIIMLFLILVVAVMLCLLRSKKKKSIAASASRGTKLSRLTESLLLLCGAELLSVSLFISTLDRNLPEGQFRIYLIIFIVMEVFIVISGLLAYFWRMGVSFTLALTVIIGYTSISGCGIIEKEKKTEPVVEHNFSVSGKFTGGEELWVNGVLLGKMPLTISGKEFNEKVPFMETPPDGFSKDNPNQPTEPWFKFTFWNVEWNGHMYAAKAKDYYGKIVSNGQCASGNGGGSGGGGSDTYQKYEYSFGFSLPDRDILIKEEKKRFDSLLQKARLNNYSADSDWYNTYISHTGLDLWPLRQRLKNEPGFALTIADLARHKYNIPEPLDQQTAQKIFQQICQEADQTKEYDYGGFEGQAMELIFDKLDIDAILADLAERLKDKKQRWYGASWHGDEYKAYKKYSFVSDNPNDKLYNAKASLAALLHAARLWDSKLDIEQTDTDNQVEKRIPPICISKRDDIDIATEFGGSEFEKYILRRYLRDQRVEGIELAFDDREYKYAKHFNKWLIMLADLKTPAGREFREQYSYNLIELASLMINNGFNNRRTPPDFLFYDLDKGNDSLAVKFWPEYSQSVNDSFPSWEADKLNKRLSYLARLGDLATDQMYMDCWKLVNLNKIETFPRLPSSLTVAPERIQLMILRDIKKNAEAIPDMEYYGHVVDAALIALGDQQILDELATIKPEKRQQIIGSLIESLTNLNIKNIDTLKKLARHDNPQLRQATIKFLQNKPTAANLTLLQELANDPDPAVKQAAQAALAELEKLRLMPYSELVSLQEDYAAGKLE